jgi:hypothetical protein
LCISLGPSDKLKELGARALQLHKEGKGDEVRTLLTQKKTIEAQMSTLDASPTLGYPVVEALLAQLGVILPRAVAAPMSDDVHLDEPVDVHGGGGDDDDDDDHGLDMTLLSSAMPLPPQMTVPVAAAAPPASAPHPPTGHLRTGGATATKLSAVAAPPAIRVVQDTSFDRQVREQKILETLRQTVDDLHRYGPVCGTLCM